ncbi:hypothetical protein USDA257_c06440 [Sinorhizobium fredii USDA 257]|uniref:Uncharacterized protein n=1 Tax=Sinorhizobium fredii (strain USDA 257) TaxID=1185652 RepID=I3X033_SINF2|nr:hypothetical protein USDA257_c06440 [Sinorhizobium fredii USDA 257]
MRFASAIAGARTLERPRRMFGEGRRAALKTHALLRESAGFRTAREVYIKVDHCMVPLPQHAAVQSATAPSCIRAL